MLGIIVVTFVGFAVGALCMALANRRVTTQIARARWRKLLVFFLIVHIVLGVAGAGRPWVSAIVLLIVAAGAVELWSAWRRIPSPRPGWIWPLFVVVAISVLGVSWTLSPLVFAFLFLVTAASDGFSQVVGQLIGRRPLAPAVSPAKTVEGLVGGLVAAVVVAMLVRQLLGQAAAPVVIAIALLIAIAGLMGDLAASWVKRRAGMKDYSAALPGQGGFLDRFDSLLGAMAIVGPMLSLAA